MTYATALNMLNRYDAEEMAQRADRSVPRLVTAAMLQTAAAAGDMSGYTADEQAATTKALARINEALQAAQDRIDGYLQGRYTLPLVTTPRILMAYACDIARKELYDDQVTDVISDRNKEAIRFLEAVGQGKLSLGLDTGNAPVEGGDTAEFSSQAKVFGRDGDTVDGKPGGSAFI